MADEERDHEAEAAESSLERRVFTRRDVVKGGGATVGALSIAWLLAACGGGGGGGETTAPADTGGAAGTGAAAETVPAGAGGEVEKMTWAINGDAIAMDYALAYDFNTNSAMTNVTEPLLRVDPGGQLQPNLALSWEQVDPLTLTIKLRTGVKFHDGTEMTADDVAFSLNRHRDPDVGSYLATFHERVKDCQATASDEVTVTFTTPDAIFPYAMSTMAGAVASKAFIEANGDKVGTPAVGIVGTGPFKYTSWTKGQEIVLDRFDDYWNVERARKVKQFVVKSFSTRRRSCLHCRR